jgi:hypothetical protein
MVSPSEDTPEEEDLIAELDAISSDDKDGGTSLLRATS